jgi:hypothetical protein
MIMELEQQIRDLQKELAEVRMEQATLRLKPCRGDSDIRKKDAKIDELDRRATILKKHHGSTKSFPVLIHARASCDSHVSDDSS